MKERVYIIVVGETTRNNWFCTQTVYVMPEEKQSIILNLKENYENQESYPRSLDDEDDLNLSKYKIDNLTYDYTNVEVLGLITLTY